jgi:hypothetical protein
MKTATEYILEAPRVHQNDIESALSERDIQAIDEFEEAWREFVSSRPGVLPPGAKLRSCLAIEYQIDDVEVSKRNVQMEMQRQLDFFNSSKDQLEANFTRAMEEAALMQQDVNKRLTKEISDIADADESLSTTLPWEHFFDNLDSLAEEACIAEEAGGGLRALKPSNRALYLANNIDHTEVAMAALEGRSSALLLHAFNIDNALLNAEIRMMQREVDRLEKTTKSQQVMAKFLTEHNIWGLLTKSGAGTVVSAGSTKISGRRTYMA